MTICSIKNCGKPSAAHGLCAKHYMRQRRHGDPSVKHKPGPKPRPVVDMATAMNLVANDVSLLPKLGRALYSDSWSPRTISDWEKAMTILQSLREEHGVATVLIIEAAQFRNGKVNVSRLLELAQDLWLKLEPVEE
jgi:hypothetical protein